MPIEFEILIQIRDLGDDRQAATHRNLMTRRDLFNMVTSNPALFEEHYGSEGLMVAKEALEAEERRA